MPPHVHGRDGESGILGQKAWASLKPIKVPIFMYLTDYSILGQKAWGLIESPYEIPT